MPTPIEIRLLCEPAQGFVTTLTIEPGWSPSTMAECVHARATNTNGTQTSVTVERPSLADCVPLPEPNGSSLLGAAFLALLLLARRPRKRVVNP